MSGVRHQPSLFGEPPIPAGRRVEKVGPAKPSDELLVMAGALPRNLRLGTSSWSFPGWRGLVYDREANSAELARDGLAAYAQHPLLRTVGVDRTYYAPVPSEKFAEWAEVVPQGFRFLVKAPAVCTSPYDPTVRATTQSPNPHFLNPTFATDAIVGPALAGLQGKLGVIVFQFSPLPATLRSRPDRFADEIHRFLGGLPDGAAYAVELRDRTLWTRRFACAVVDAGGSPCFSLHPRVPALDEQLSAAEGLEIRTLVIRWMLHTGQDYDEARRRYAPFSELVDEDPGSRNAVAALCHRSLAEGKETLVIANNKAEGSAPLTLAALARAILGSAGPMPDSKNSR